MTTTFTVLLGSQDEVDVEADDYAVDPEERLQLYRDDTDDPVATFRVWTGIKRADA
jgi:hypothetical protein